MWCGGSRGEFRSYPTAGNNCILVDVQEHPHPMEERLRDRSQKGPSSRPPEGRARGCGRRADLHLWTDVPVPALGAVEPVLWDELEARRALCWWLWQLVKEYC